METAKHCSTRCIGAPADRSTPPRTPRRWLARPPRPAITPPSSDRRPARGALISSVLRGKRAAQRRQQPTIRSCQPRPRPLSAQDRKLMTEDENLQLLRATPPPHQPQHREQVPDNEIDERPEQTPSRNHDSRALNLARSPSSNRDARDFQGFSLVPRTPGTAGVPANRGGGSPGFQGRRDQLAS